MRRIFAAADMTTSETDAKLVPLRPKCEAFLAAIRARRNLSNVDCMFTRAGVCWHIDHRSLAANRSPSRTKIVPLARERCKNARGCPAK